MKQNLKRSVALTFRVSKEEREIIKKRMKLAGITTMRTFLLKMALTGRVISVEMDSISECNRLLRIIGNNINQVAKRANVTGNVYEADLAEIKERQGEIWEQQNKIIGLLSKLVERVA